VVDGSSAKIKMTWTLFIIVVLHNIKVMERHGNRPKIIFVHYGLKRSQLSTNDQVDKISISIN